MNDYEFMYENVEISLANLACVVMLVVDFVDFGDGLGDGVKRKEPRLQDVSFTSLARSI